MLSTVSGVDRPLLFAGPDKLFRFHPPLLVYSYAKVVGFGPHPHPIHTLVQNLGWLRAPSAYNSYHAPRGKAGARLVSRRYQDAG